MNCALAASVCLFILCYNTEASVQVKTQFFKKQDFQDVGFNLYNICPECDVGLKAMTFIEEEKAEFSS